MSLLGDWTKARTKTRWQFILLGGFCFGLMQLLIFHLVFIGYEAFNSTAGFNIRSLVQAAVARFLLGKNLVFSVTVFFGIGLLWAIAEWHTNYKPVNNLSARVQRAKE
jgi:hypothetical protein